MALAMVAAGQVTALVLDWKCERCDRYLARVVGDRFETPGGVAGRLPATIRCPNCKHASVRAAPIDVTRRAQ